MHLPLALSVALERGMALALSLDPETRARLADIDGKVIQLQLTSPATNITLLINDLGIHVNSRFDGEPDTVIRGSAAALKSLSSSNEAMHNGSVSVHGDIAAGQQLREILTSLDIDWEELIAPVVGDTVAHQLGVLQQRLGKWFNRNAASMRANASEYLQEEAELLAPTLGIEAYCSDVDELTAAADRLEARIQLLENASKDSVE